MHSIELIITTFIGLPIPQVIYTILFLLQSLRHAYNRTESLKGIRGNSQRVCSNIQNTKMSNGNIMDNVKKHL